jgi:hypothetical protein
MLRFLLPLFLTLLSGCVTLPLAPTASISKEAAPVLSDDKGLVITSVTYSGSFNSHALHYAKIGQGEGPSFAFPPQLFGFNGKSDITNKEIEGTVQISELAAGDYEFYEWRGKRGGVDYRTRQRFSVRFTIAPGKVTYLGNIFFDFDRSPSSNGFYNLKIEDELKRDLEIAKAKYPLLKLSTPDFQLREGVKVEYVGSGTAANSNFNLPIGPSFRSVMAK